MISYLFLNIPTTSLGIFLVFAEVTARILHFRCLREAEVDTLINALTNLNFLEIPSRIL